jgi:lambda family phage minor tail protein L
MPTKSEVYYQITGGYSDINSEIGKIEPSTQVNLYEIDLKNVYPLTSSINFSGQPLKNGMLRIYNDVNLFNISNDENGRILWKNEYFYPFPIHSEGFDLTTLGARPTPKVFIANTSPDQSYNSFYKYIRMQIQSLGDIAGSKFTRIKTFLKYLHQNNFSGNVNPYSTDSSIIEVELPKDIYYIDRKTSENSVMLEYSLVSALDIENLTLPNRTIFSKRCPFSYRGEGCLYEYNKRTTAIHSGVYGNIVNSPVKITLPLEAPPVSTENDEKFLGTVFANGSAAASRFTGLAYFRAGIDQNYSQWSFTNYTLAGGTTSSAATLLSDNSSSVVGLTSLDSPGTVTLSLNTGTEITRVVLGSNSTIKNNYQLEYSQDGTNWYNVPNLSGLSSNWSLSGYSAGTYSLDFASQGINKYWRLTTLNNFAGTQISELNFSGQYRIADSGEWITGSRYQPGEFTFFEKNGTKYYYVCIKENTGNLDTSLTNTQYWQSDSCSKSISACRDRWFKNPYFRPVLWPIPRNGWTWDRAVYHYDSQWGEKSVQVREGKPSMSFTGFAGEDFIFNSFGYHSNGYGSIYRIGSIVLHPTKKIPYFPNPTENRLDCWPRRPDAIDPKADFACGIPKDSSGNYLNGFLPFGGFPGTNSKS